MSNVYEQLLDATVAELQRMKMQGQRHVSLSPEGLASLKSLGDTARAPARSPEMIVSMAVPSPVVAAAPTRSHGQPMRPTGPSVAILTTDAPAPGSVEPDRQATGEAMANLRSQALACQKCPHLVRSRKNVVFGVGDIHSPLMFVGEAPGADEDTQGEPFVGKAGQLLTKIIQTMGFSRDTVYIANILKCRPDTPGQSAGNRKPTPEEMQTCMPYLMKQIELIKPKVIVALGATAVEGLLGKTAGITKLRGHFQSFLGTPVMPTYHPAFLLRNQALSVKREVWEDMLLVLEKLGRPISQKQRNYFLAKP